MKRRKSKILSLLLVFSLFIGMVGIVNVDYTYAATKKIHLKKKTITLAEGKKYTQKLIAKNGKTIKGTAVKWKSLRPSVAKINKKGKITAVKSGKAKFTARYKGKKYKFTVKVRKPKLTPPVIKVTTEFSDNEIWTFVEWKDVKDALKYKVYVSQDGGSYKYITTEKYGDPTALLINESLAKSSKKEITYRFKVRAFNGKYKSAYSNIVTITLSKDGFKTKYTTSDVLDLLDYVGDAQDWGNEIIDDTNYWSYDSYDSDSEYVDCIKTDASKALSHLKKAKAITAAKKTRYCNSDEAAEAGFTTWDKMIASLISQCNSVKNADVESMSDLERMQLAQKALKLSQEINYAYIEIYDYEENK